MIKINYDELQTIRHQLGGLVGEAIMLLDPLMDSKGKAAQTEKEILELLIQICRKDLPQLFTSTEKLLEIISSEFQEAENKISETILNG